MDDPVAILVAARDEADRIGSTVAALREQFPGCQVLVADDGSRDGTAAVAEAAGATALRLPPRGKGHALSAAEQVAPAGPLLLCDADIVGELRPLVAADADLAVARFATRVGGGFGVTKHAARALVRVRCGYRADEPISGQRAVSALARAVCFPLAPGFGCDARMTIDAVRMGLRVEEIELPLGHRPTGRDVAGFVHRGRQLVDVAAAAGPLAVNYRGLRLPLVGWLFAARRDPVVATVAALGLADDLWGGRERGFAAHVRALRTTGVLKLVGIPAVAFLATRSASAAALVGLAANAVNQLDTRPGRALKAYLGAALVLGAPKRLAVLVLPYDLREMVMLGDGGSNALGAMLGLSSVGRLTGRGRWLAIGALAALNLIGDRRSLGDVVERTPGLAYLDRLGRRAA